MVSACNNVCLMHVVGELLFKCKERTYSGTGLESKLCVRATIGLFECIGEPNFRSPFANVCSKPGVSFNTSMWMDHTNKP